MWKAILKYGWDNFKHEVLLGGISKSEADYAEKYLIRWYKMHGNSYNVTDGGDGSCGLVPWNKGKKTGIIPWNKGIPMSEETIKRVSSHQLSRDIDVTQKTAWFILQKIRTLFTQDDTIALMGDVDYEMVKQVA